MGCQEHVFIDTATLFLQVVQGMHFKLSAAIDGCFLVMFDGTTDLIVQEVIVNTALMDDGSGGLSSAKTLTLCDFVRKERRS